MDAERFDAVARALTDGTSRRTALGLSLGGLIGGAYLLGSEAKRKKRKKKKKCKGGTKKCGKKCIPPTACCSNADCGFQGACEAGVCDCKSGAKFCQDTCIPQDDCCTDEECPDPRVCDSGDCVCPTGQKDCNGTCIPLDVCCDDADCDTDEICLGNGSCATLCDFDNPDCPGTCLCRDQMPPSDQVLPVCFASGQQDVCSLPACESSADCDPGQACELVICTSMVGRCVLLC